VTALAPTLQAFFTDRLARQRHASGHTIAAYRDTWRLLLAFASQKTRQQPCQLDLADLDAPLIGAFLDQLEAGRGNSVRTRNARRAAVHSLFRYAALRHPEHAEVIARVLAIPPKRCDKALVTWLTEAEIAALLAAPDRTTWAGRRDHALILLAAQTGLRISELTGLATGRSAAGRRRTTAPSEASTAGRPDRPGSRSPERTSPTPARPASSPPRQHPRAARPSHSSPS
jgi:integrase/recombinase XerD